MHYARWLKHGEAGDATPLHVGEYQGKACSVDDCEKPAKAKGMCIMHYKRVRNHGTTERLDRKIPKAELFERYVTRTDGCWEWNGPVTTHGYTGLGRHGLGHRWSYEQQNGEIPESLVIDHLCRNKTCTNPDHLEAVTNQENLARGLGYRLMNGMDDKCVHGHLYTEENTYTDPQGGIRCRSCQREAEKRRTPRKRKKTNKEGI